MASVPSPCPQRVGSRISMPRFALRWYRSTPKRLTLPMQLVVFNHPGKWVRRAALVPAFDLFNSRCMRFSHRTAEWVTSEHASVFEGVPTSEPILYVAQSRAAKQNASSPQNRQLGEWILF